MERVRQTRTVAILLAALTAFLAVLAVGNFRQELRFQTPTDGIVWTEASGGILAERVPANSAGERAGLKAGDLLLAANMQATPRIGALVRAQFHAKVYGSVDYTVARQGIRFDIPVILDAADTGIHSVLRFIALVYLGIGLYVLFRRWTAPHATHFYLFCLLSFALYALVYTGRFDALDRWVYWAGVAAGALQPACFLHFAIAFSRPPRFRRLALGLVYAPAAGLVALQLYAVARWQATGLLAHRLDQTAVAFLAAYSLLATGSFALQYRAAGQERGPETGQVLRRQQLKWLTRGAALSVVPFTALYAVPYVLGWAVPNALKDVAVLALVVLPLFFAWAIVRYRLMDVDLILKRGVTYTLATALLLGLYFAVVGATANLVHTRLPNFGAWGLVAAIVVTSALFDPVKRRIQGRVDRLFDHRRYDSRQTLIEFGRGLGTQTDLQPLLESITARLAQTLLVARVAVFVAGEDGAFELGAAHGLPAPLPRLALGFLDRFQDRDRREAGSHIFLENPHQALHLPADERGTAGALELHYYLPCRAGDRTIAVLGLGRTTDGDFLSSEDVELLESLAGYAGIAIQNATLYARLQRKALEFERLKEFNENIVESTNVGILAVDLEERIESWNAQMEVLFALPRAEAIGAPLAAVFDAEFVRAFDRVKISPGVHHLWKFPLRSPGGAPEPRFANISIAPLVSREFATLGRIVLVDDITARVGLESQLAQAEKLSSIGLLAAGVAHEVNTPLAVISSYTQMLAKQLRDDRRLAPLLDKITKQTFRASEIVNGLLNFSRTGAAEFRPVDLNAVVRETLSLVEHQLRTANIELRCDLDPGLPAIQGNSGKLQQVFLNLFLNARDAMAAGGQLRVTTAYNGVVTVAVADSGSGIAPEHVDRIYDPFFTTKTAPKEGERRGTGLGLAVTYGIMQEHAGKIRVESRPGAGTTFALDFPLKEAPAHA